MDKKIKRNKLIETTIVATVVAAGLENRQGHKLTRDNDDNEVFDWIEKEKEKDKIKIENRTDKELKDSILKGEHLLMRLLKNLHELYLQYINGKVNINKTLKNEIIKYCMLNNKFEQSIRKSFRKKLNMELPSNYTLDDLFPLRNLTTTESRGFHNSLKFKIQADIAELAEFKF
ncbi:hypothetical protein [Seonamhaeicola sp.]|uniref:hypothetical protein n=1 Tax=Seonamhaeicola sp. TaxID=1912245 RepID=UPI002635D005|nr:hypothetical protein [Seonamhaeicola sp.]